MECKDILKRLKESGKPENVAGMARFGIKPKAQVFGVPMPELRKIAKEIKKDHKLALKLWESGVHEAKILAGIIADPQKISSSQIKRWVKDFDSWDVCDQVCMNLFDKSENAIQKIPEWAKSNEEFIKRTAFSLMAALAFHKKDANDRYFKKFFPIIKRGACDDRNFVKKSVNWALRQIGKRNKALNKEAIMLAKEIQKMQSKPARWIASNALSELQSETVKKRLK